MSQQGDDTRADVAAVHADHGATMGPDDRTVRHYGRPERTHRAVRNGVGVIHWPVDVVTVSGADRIEYVDNVLSNRIPNSPTAGCYALLLNPDGTIATEVTVYGGPDRLLLLLPPDQGGPLVEDWREKVFIQDVTIESTTTAFAVFGLHGPQAVDKLASVYDADVPNERWTLTRGAIGSIGVTVARTDAPTGEPSFDVICASEDAADLFTSLVSLGSAAVPFGQRTWSTLTLEAGTPLFETELEGVLPNAVGIEAALDFEKGCYVGQEVVSRIKNRGQPPSRLVGLTCADVPSDGSTVRNADGSIGTVTRAAMSPTLEQPIAMARVDTNATLDALSIESESEPIEATVVALPFEAGSERSGRVPVDPT